MPVKSKNIPTKRRLKFINKAAIISLGRAFFAVNSPILRIVLKAMIRINSTKPRLVMSLAIGHPTRTAGFCSIAEFKFRVQSKTQPPIIKIDAKIVERIYKTMVMPQEKISMIDFPAKFATAPGRKIINTKNQKHRGLVRV